MSVRLLFAWYDCWIGAYWDRAGRRLYVLPLPMLGFVVQFNNPALESEYLRFVGNEREAQRDVCRHGHPNQDIR